MGRRACRDCPRCTESCLVAFVTLPFRVVYRLLTFWNLGLVTRYCPECGHRLNLHKKVGGRFVD
jgi:ribosomal protein S27AE